MNTKLIGIAVLALATGCLSACGGNTESPSSTSAKAGSGGGSSSGASGSSGGVMCAKMTCELPSGMTGQPCCMDPFTGGCGITSGGSCRALPKSDDRCPVPSALTSAGSAAGGLTFVGCCTSDNDCGVDYGVGGCRAIKGLCEFPKQLLHLFTAQTCDGTPETIPDSCGSDMNVQLPGAAGSGT